MGIYCNIAEPGMGKEKMQQINLRRATYLSFAIYLNTFI